MRAKRKIAHQKGVIMNQEDELVELRRQLNEEEDGQGENIENDNQGPPGLLNDSFFEESSESNESTSQ